MKKSLLCLSLLISLFLVGCSKSEEVNAPRTLEQLKEKKINNPSEYDKCLKEISENEKEEKQCVENKLKEKGFNDGIDCIQESDLEICESIDRYNGEIDSINDCQEKFKGVLNMLDCVELIGK